MGTRHLIAVQIDGKYPVAQYGQWDGYPDGQGLKVLTFLRDEMREDTFRRKVRALHVIDDAWKLAQFPGATSLEDVSGEPVAEYFRKHPTAIPRCGRQDSRHDPVGRRRHADRD